MTSFAERWFQNFPIPLYFISITLHLTGLYGLILVGEHRSNQDIILMSISVSEILMSICDFTQNILSRFVLHTDAPINYLTIVQCTLFVLPSFLTMIVLALDRFSSIYLNIKYHVYVTRKRMKMIISICWILSFMTMVIFVILRSTLYPNIAQVIFMYLFPAVEGCVLLAGFFSYTYIYRKIKSFRDPPVQPSVRGNVVVRKRKRLIFSPFLILLTFLLFAIIPDIVNLMIFYVYKDIGTNLHSNILLTLYVVGFILDAAIYILLQKHIRRKISRSLLNFRRNRVSNTISNTVTVYE